MHHKRYFIRLCVILLFLLSDILLLGCSSKAQSSSQKQSAKKESVKVKSSGTKGKRNHTSKVLSPEAPGIVVLGSSPLTIDISNKDQGYVTALYTGTAAKANIQITGPDNITYKYFIYTPNESVTLPLTGGNGSYTIAAYENIVDNKYASLYKETIDVSLESEFLPYLYPNQYVDFNAETKAVATASEIVKDMPTDLEAVSAIYHYIIKNIVYDDEKAKNVKSGYLPNVDETLESKKGICFDYAALTAAMLRSQNIPTRLEIGYSGKIYHSWISVYIKDIGWIDRLIEFTGDGWTRMDPTFASSNNNNKKILKYIGDGSNYTLQYLH